MKKQIIIYLLLIMILNGCVLDTPNSNGLPLLPGEVVLEIMVADTRSEFFEFEGVPIFIENKSNNSIVIENESAIQLFLWVPSQKSWVKIDFRILNSQVFPAEISHNQSLFLILSPQVKPTSETLKLRLFGFAKTPQGATIGGDTEFSVRPMGKDNVPSVTLHDLVNASQKQALSWQSDAFLARIFVDFPVKDKVNSFFLSIDYLSANTKNKYTAQVALTGKMNYSWGTNALGVAFPINPGECRIEIREAIVLLMQQDSSITWPSDRRSWLILERQQIGLPLSWYFYELMGKTSP